MVAPHPTVKKFRDFLGVDLKSSDIKRGSQFASGGKNVDFTVNNSISKRRGYQYRTNTAFRAGLAQYARVNDEGVPDEELISIGATLKKLTTSSLSVSYSGAVEGRIEFALSSGSNTFIFRAIEDNIEKLSFDCGDGVDTVVTIATLITQINLLTNFAASTTGDDSQPAAYLEIKREEIVAVGTPAAMSFEYFTAVNSTGLTMAGNTSYEGSSNFENASFVNLNNVLYVANAIDGLFKYDGQTFYKAGMPKGVFTSVVVGGAGALTGAYTYGFTHLQIDNQGQVIEGNISDFSASVSPSAQDVDLTFKSIQPDSGFNTNAGMVAGAQASVTTITLDDGAGGDHTLKLGDTAFFYDSISAAYITREITAITATTITIDGDPVTVADNDPISNNLRIAIYRTVNAGVSLFFVTEIPNNPFVVDQAYTDSLPDTSLGNTFIRPRYGHDEPPKGQYLTTYRNLLILAGSNDNPSRFNWSDSDGPEYFPLASHSADVHTKIGDVISGVGVNNDQLVIFKEQSIFVAAGDLANLNFVVDQLTSGDLGCVAHASIQEVREGVLYFLTSRGPYQIVGGQLPSPVGATISDAGQQFSRIETFFTDLAQETDVIPRLKRSVAVNWSEKAKYLLYIPSEDQDQTTTSDANVNSTVWVFDYSRGAWLPEWKNINGAAGLAVHKGQVYWAGRATPDFVAKFLDTDDEYDFADHTVAVDFEYQDNWEHLGAPNVKKKYLRLVMMVLDDIESASWNLTVEMGLEFDRGIVWASMVVPFGDEGSLGWGNSPWGEFPWGEPINSTKKLKLKANKSRALRVIYKNNELHTNILLTGWEIETATPYRAID